MLFVTNIACLLHLCVYRYCVFVGPAKHTHCRAMQFHIGSRFASPLLCPPLRLQWLSKSIRKFNRLWGCPIATLPRNEAPVVNNNSSSKLRKAKIPNDNVAHAEGENSVEQTADFLFKRMNLRDWCAAINGSLVYQRQQGRKMFFQYNRCFSILCFCLLQGRVQEFWLHSSQQATTGPSFNWRRKRGKDYRHCSDVVLPTNALLLPGRHTRYMCGTIAPFFCNFSLVLHVKPFSASYCVSWSYSES